MGGCLSSSNREHAAAAVQQPLPSPSPAAPQPQPHAQQQPRDRALSNSKTVNTTITVEWLLSEWPGLAGLPTQTVDKAAEALRQLVGPHDVDFARRISRADMINSGFRDDAVLDLLFPPERRTSRAASLSAATLPVASESSAVPSSNIGTEYDPHRIQWPPHAEALVGRSLDLADVAAGAGAGAGTVDSAADGEGSSPAAAPAASWDIIAADLDRQGPALAAICAALSMAQRAVGSGTIVWMSHQLAADRATKSRLLEALHPHRVDRVMVAVFWDFGPEDAPEILRSRTPNQRSVVRSRVPGPAAFPHAGHGHQRHTEDEEEEDRVLHDALMQVAGPGAGEAEVGRWLADACTASGRRAPIGRVVRQLRARQQVSLALSPEAAALDHFVALPPEPRFRDTALTEWLVSRPPQSLTLLHGPLGSGKSVALARAWQLSADAILVSLRRCSVDDLLLGIGRVLHVCGLEPDEVRELRDREPLLLLDGLDEVAGLLHVAPWPAWTRDPALLRRVLLVEHELPRARVVVTLSDQDDPASHGRPTCETMPTLSATPPATTSSAASAAVTTTRRADRPRGPGEGVVAIGTMQDEFVRRFSASRGRPEPPARLRRSVLTTPLMLSVYFDVYDELSTAAGCESSSMVTPTPHRLLELYVAARLAAAAADPSVSRLMASRGVIGPGAARQFHAMARVTAALSLPFVRVPPSAMCADDSARDLKVLGQSAVEEAAWSAFLDELAEAAVGAAAARGSSRIAIGSGPVRIFSSFPLRVEGGRLVFAHQALWEFYAAEYMLETAAAAAAAASAPAPDREADQGNQHARTVPVRVLRAWASVPRLAVTSPRLLAHIRDALLPSPRALAVDASPRDPRTTTTTTTTQPDSAPSASTWPAPGALEREAVWWSGRCRSGLWALVNASRRMGRRDSRPPVAPGEGGDGGDEEDDDAVADAAANALTALYAAGDVLSGADLSGARVRGAALSHAVLDGADLRGADLRFVDLSEASLRGAQLQGSLLNGATFGTILVGHGLPRQPVNAVAFSPDGFWLVTVGDDRTARAWDAESGRAVSVFRGHSSMATCCDVTFASLAMASVSGSGRSRPASRSGVPADADADADAEDAVVAQDLADGDAADSPVDDEEDTDAREPEDAYAYVVVSGGADGVAHLWDLASGEGVQTLRGHRGEIRSAVFSRNGRWVATGADDGTVRVWDPASGTQLELLSGHMASVRMVGFSPDGRRIVSSSSDESAIVWELGQAAVGGTNSAGPLVLHGSHSHLVTAASFSPDGMHVLTASWDSSVRVWRVADGSELAVLLHHGPVAAAVFVGEAGDQIAAGGSDGSVQLWDWRARARVGSRRFRWGAVRGLAWSQPELSLAVAFADGVAEIWDLAHCARDLRRWAGHQAPLLDGCWAAEGDQAVLTCARDAGDSFAVGVWDSATGAAIAELVGHQAQVSGVAASPDGRKAVTWSTSDGSVRVWDVRTASETTSLRLRGAQSSDSLGPGVTGAVFTPDGLRVLVAAAPAPAAAAAAPEKSLHVFDSSSGVWIRSVALSRGAGGVPYRAHRVCVSADGLWGAAATVPGEYPDARHLAVWPMSRLVADRGSRSDDELGGSDGGSGVAAHVRYLELGDGAGAVASLCASRHGGWVAAGGTNGTVTIFDAASGVQVREIAVAPRGVAATAVAFSADGSVLVAGCADGRAECWDALTGERRSVVRAPAAPSGSVIITSLSWSGDGTRLFLTCEDGSAGVFGFAGSATSDDGIVQQVIQRPLWSHPPAAGLECAGADFSGAQGLSDGCRALVASVGATVGATRGSVVV